MDPFKYEYSESTKFLSGKITYYCTVTDLRDDEEYMGSGTTKKAAKEDAKATYYKERKYRSNSYSNDSDSTYSSTSNSSSTSSSTINTNIGCSPAIICIVLAILCGWLSMWGYDFFHEAKYASKFTIKGGLGPLFGMITMAAGAIGCIISIFAFFSSLSSD